MQLTDKVAVVTGGAHRVGKGVVMALARAGCHVVIHYGRSEDEAEQTRAEAGALGVEAICHSADLSDPAAIAGLFARIESHFGHLDVLVNSAARFDHGPFDAISVEDWEKSMRVNLRAPFLATQHAARLMGADRAESALIVNIGDLSGVHPWRSFTQHGVSKAGLLHLTRITARVLAPDVRVNALVLGPILPPQHAGEESEGWQRLIEAVPLKRSGNPQGVGEMVVTLAHNDFATGAIINLDSGEGLIGPGVN